MLVDPAWTLLDNESESDIEDAVSMEPKSDDFSDVEQVNPSKEKNSKASVKQKER